MTPEVRALVEYRLCQAEESLVSARVDRHDGRLGGSISRGYYAMFYAALALLASRQITPSKHAGLIAKVSEQFIKNGPYPGHLGRTLNRAFDLRQKADYRDFLHQVLSKPTRSSHGWRNSLPKLVACCSAAPIFP